MKFTNINLLLSASATTVIITAPLIRAQTPCPAPWVLNSVYDEGDQVTSFDNLNVTNNIYECNAWPWNTLCGQAGFQPGQNEIGPGDPQNDPEPAWKLAWTLVGGCSRTPPDIQPFDPSRRYYEAGEIVTNEGKVWRCRVWPWSWRCHQDGYEPGEDFNGYPLYLEAWEEVLPTNAPSIASSNVPSESPSNVPSESPSDKPSLLPSESPSNVPSLPPSESPSNVPSESPSNVPSTSAAPSNKPSLLPSESPSNAPSNVPSTSVAPSNKPSLPPSESPSNAPSNVPSTSVAPSNKPSLPPSESPSNVPSNVPSDVPSTSAAPSNAPSIASSNVPSVAPSNVPSESHVPSASGAPSNESTISVAPSNAPSVSAAPSCQNQLNRDPINICLAIDTSFSICSYLYQNGRLQCDSGPQLCCGNFVEEMDFAKSAVTALESPNTQYSVAVFDTNVKPTSQLQLSDAGTTLSTLDGIYYGVGATNHHLAIDACQSTFANSTIPNAILLITDGKSSDASFAIAAADAAKADGTEIIPVLVLSRLGYTLQETVDLMTTLSSGTVLTANDFTDLTSTLGSLVTEVFC